MLAIARALMEAKVELAAPLIFLGNVGEEGEGDLRGVRHLYQQQALAGRIAAHIVLDGAGADSAVTQALGSRRYRVTVTGPGGHSFTDAGTPNPIAALASALAVLAADATAGGAADYAESGHDSRRHQRELHSGERAGYGRFPLHQLGRTGAAGGRAASRRGRCRGALQRAGKNCWRTGARPAGF
jgi:acetylornithine deacetylase/succinyl-diaminopimelate desuccinylase-like protein